MNRLLLFALLTITTAALSGCYHIVPGSCVPDGGYRTYCNRAFFGGMSCNTVPTTSCRWVRNT